MRTCSRTLLAATAATCAAAFSSLDKERTYNPSGLRTTPRPTYDRIRRSSLSPLVATADGRPRVRVVIVGGGYAGSVCARLLQKNKQLDVTLIDEASEFVFSPSLASLLVNPVERSFRKQLERVRWRHADYLTHGRFISGRAVDINLNSKVTTTQQYASDSRPAAGSVVLSPTRFSPGDPGRSTERVDFDILLVCTGSEYPAPWKTSASQANALPTSFDERLAAWRKRLAEAKTVAVTGGGPVGVEIASALLDSVHFSGRDVILIHSHDRLLSSLPIAASEHAFKYIQQHGGRVILGRRLTSVVEKELTLDSGEKITADVVIPCSGLQPNPNFAASALGDALTPPISQVGNDIDTRGRRLQVDPTLLVRGQSRIFALGDVCDMVGDDRYVVEQVKTAVDNVCALGASINASVELDRSQLNRVPIIGHRYKVVSLGTDDGIEIRDDAISATGSSAALQKRLQERILMLMFWLGINI